MQRFVRWLLGTKTPQTTPSLNPLDQPPKKKSNIHRLDQGVARNQIDREKKQPQRPTDDLGEQER
jgi:hypothetical protein